MEKQKFNAVLHRLLPLLFSLISLSALCWEIEYQGLYFQLYSNDQCTLLAKPKEKYSGDIKIPSKVPYGNTIYKVTSIGSEAFKDCSNLTSVEIPNSVITIDNSAFHGCSALTSVVIPNSVTEIGKYAFYGCSSLEKAEFASIESICNISFGGFEANPLSNAHHLYINEQEITDLVIPNSVTKIGNYAFYCCYGLTSVQIPNSVTEIGNYAFSGCTGLTSVEIPNSVITIGDNSFSSCTGLTSVEIPNSVTVIGNWAFYRCSGLTTIEISNSVTTIGVAAFQYCTGLTSVEIPNSITTIGGRAFQYCTGLTSVEIPNSVTKIWGGAFYGCSALTSVKIPNSVTMIGGSAFQGCSGLTSVEISNSVTTIGDGAFKGCTGLTSVEIPNSVITIDKSAFSSCTGLTSVKIPNSVTTIGESAFSNCSGLTSIKIPNSVTEIGAAAFLKCYNLTSLFIGNSVQYFRAAKLRFDDPNGVDFILRTVWPWTDCSNIKEVIYTAKDPIKADKDIFDNNIYSQATLYLLEEAIPKVETKMSWGWFDKIEKYTGPTEDDLQSGDDLEYNGIIYTVIDPEAKTVKTKDGDSSTAGNQVSGSLSLPQKVGYKDYSYDLIEIGEYSFSNCNQLSAVTIPNSVTVIGNNAFTACSNLKSLKIGDGVKTFGEYIWSQCPDIEVIEYTAKTLTSGDKNIFDDNVYNNATLRLQDSVQEEAANISPWKWFADLEKVTPYELSYSLSSSEATVTGFTAEALADVEIPSEYTENGKIYSVTRIAASAFKESDMLKSVIIPPTIKSIDPGAFNGCSNLSVVIYNARNVTNVWNHWSSPIFGNCPNLTSIKIGQSVKNLPKYIFKTTPISSIVIPDNVTDLEDDCFASCLKLSDITIGKGVEVIKCASFALELGETAPATTLRVNSVNLTSYTGLNGGTSYLPFNNRNVETIILGDEVESFTGYSFRECKPTVIESHNATPPALGAGCFNSTNKQTCKLYVPKGAKNAYSTADVWKEFANISDPLSDGGLQAGDDFTYNGITYTVIDPEAKTVKTKEGYFENNYFITGNPVSGDVILPEKAYHGEDCYILTEIGSYGFMICGINSVEMPNSVTKIGVGAFNGCINLASVQISNSVTEICDIAFQQCI